MFQPARQMVDNSAGRIGPSIMLSRATVVAY